MQILGCKKRDKKLEKWGTVASKRPAVLRAGAMGKTPPYLPDQSPPADAEGFPSLGTPRDTTRCHEIS